jgi:hypothetical protein
LIEISVSLSRLRTKHLGQEWLRFRIVDKSTNGLNKYKKTAGTIGNLLETFFAWPVCRGDVRPIDEQAHAASREKLDVNAGFFVLSQIYTRDVVLLEEGLNVVFWAAGDDDFDP